MRNPRLSAAVAHLESAVGKEEAQRMVRERPQAILDNVLPDLVAPVPGLRASAGGTNTAVAARPWQKRFWLRG